jgi:hypothetical protein
VGYNSAREIVFAEDGGTVQRLREEERSKLEALATELPLPFSVKDKLPGFISLSITVSTISHSNYTHPCIATHQP